jgi:hypothetical protein
MKKRGMEAMRALIQRAALCLGAVSVSAIAAEIEILNETDYGVRVKVAGTETAVPSAAGKWISTADRVSITRPGGDTLEYRFEDTRTGSTVDTCAYNVVPWGYRVKLFEKTSSTGVERVLGEICAARAAAHTDTLARLRFHIDENGDYGLVFENRGAMSEIAGRVASMSAALPGLGKSSGITSGLLRSDDYVFAYKDQCLINGSRGRDLVPQRFSWGGAGLCGLGAAAVYKNRQAVITLRKVDAERYVLLSAMWRLEYQGGWSFGEVFGGRGCLQANANGTVERTHAGTSHECHLLSDADFLNRPELLWKIRQVDGVTLITSNAHDGIEKCLLFGYGGAAITPTLFNWGLGGEVCGLPRGDFISNGQAVWKLIRLN